MGNRGEQKRPRTGFHPEKLGARGLFGGDSELGLKNRFGGENTACGLGVEFKWPAKHSFEVYKRRMFQRWVYLQKDIETGHGYVGATSKELAPDGQDAQDGT